MLKIPIFEQKIIAEKTYEVSFGLSGKKFDFLAGQYIRVIAPKLLHPDPRGSSRVFSILSSPNDKNKISVAFRDSGSGFKRTLMELPIGSFVDIQGPFGDFTLPKDISFPLVFIAGGIGITTFLSMIRYIAEQKLTYQITLLYGNRNAESAAYLKELVAITKQNSHLVLKNQFEHIDANFIQQSIKNFSEPTWYIVGHPAMVAEMRELLLHLNINDSRIYSEDFFGY